jgi:hypothetical protein
LCRKPAHAAAEDNLDEINAALWVASHLLQAQSKFEQLLLLIRSSASVTATWVDKVGAMLQHYHIVEWFTRNF